MSRSQKKSNKVVLSYHDCILREEDVELLTGPYWLNDVIISFYFEYLGQKFMSSSMKFLFLSPELTQLLKLTQEYPIFLDPIDAIKKDLIFFPVNDCNSRNSAGGSHWSLMVFSRIEKTCYYFDSSYGLNSSVAREFARSIMGYLLNEEHGQFVEVDCPQQENGYDCGLFVLCYTDIIAEYALQESKIQGCNCDNVQQLVSEKRQNLIDLIDRLKNNP